MGQSSSGMYLTYNSMQASNTPWINVDSLRVVDPEMALHIAYDGMLSYIWDGSTPGKRLLGLAVAVVHKAILPLSVIHTCFLKDCLCLQGSGGRPLSLTSCIVRAILKASFW
jgi:hypothetical protein